MDTRTLFQKISKKMHADFEASAQILHSGNKGTMRENVLRNFLAAGRLPTKYALGSGEVVGRVKDTSRQCDLIIYDRENGVTLLGDENVQVYPADCVYGIIEVKSSLSKSELIDSVEKIKIFKNMAPTGTINKAIGGGMMMAYHRPRPFGMVFSYALSGNSLESLLDNLIEWERANPPSLWPNYICILGEGIIYHNTGSFENCIDSEKITENSWPLFLNYKEDSLFQFYCALHDACAHMSLGPVELMRYYEPDSRIGKYVVGGRVEFDLIIDDVKFPSRLSEGAVDRIVGWCKSNGKLTWREILIKKFGRLPDGEYSLKSLERQVYFYNPQNLPGLHDLGSDALVRDESGCVTYKEKCISGTFLLIIDDENYEIPFACLNIPEDFDVFPVSGG